MNDNRVELGDRIIFNSQILTVIGVLQPTPTNLIIKSFLIGRLSSLKAARRISANAAINTIVARFQENANRKLACMSGLPSGIR